jgi:hypothetical protein
MLFEKRIDDLVEAGRQVLDSDFDEVAFQRWRKEAFKFLSAVLGPEHSYTQYFEKYVRQLERSEVLTGGGILIAAKAEVAKEPPQMNRGTSPGEHLAGRHLCSLKSSCPALMLTRH